MSKATRISLTGEGGGGLVQREGLHCIRGFSSDNYPAPKNSVDAQVSPPRAGSLLSFSIWTWTSDLRPQFLFNSKMD
jgi:hypothetical protein